MRIKKRIGKKLWIIIIVALVIQILFDPLSSMINLGENIQARIGLPIARARWDAQHIENYSFEIWNGLGGICMASARVEVRNGKVDRVFFKDNLLTMKISKTPMSRKDWANPYYPDIFFCDYANFTMPQIFGEVEKSLGYISRISFDMKYGFVSGVRFGSPGGKGLMSPRIFDCCSGFSITNFQVLDK
jgi:hypothetical protein